MSERGRQRNLLYQGGYHYSIMLFLLLENLIYSGKYKRPFPFSDIYYDSEEYDKWLTNQINRLMNE